MSLQSGTTFRILPVFVLFFAALGAYAQGGNAGTVRGTVTDHTGAVVPNATVHLTNEVSGLDRIWDDECHRPIRVPQHSF